MIFTLFVVVVVVDVARSTRCCRDDLHERGMTADRNKIYYNKKKRRYFSILFLITSTRNSISIEMRVKAFDLFCRFFQKQTLTFICTRQIIYSAIRSINF